MPARSPREDEREMFRTNAVLTDGFAFWTNPDGETLAMASVRPYRSGASVCELCPDPGAWRVPVEDQWISVCDRCKRDIVER
jgi:hypothetical protein